METEYTFPGTNIPVAYEDEWLLVINKPSGLIVIPSPKKESRTLTSILNEALILKKTGSRLYPCHRLDRDTSGLIIYAKTKSVRQKVMDEFRARKVKKTYIAFAHGKIFKNRGVIKNSINGLGAVTKYKIIERRRDFDIIEIAPVTGRRNQIRIHLKQIGHPLVGERKFAFRKDYKLQAKRICLHAESLELRHPVKNEFIRVTSLLPRYMQEFLEKHR